MSEKSSKKFPPSPKKSMVKLPSDKYPEYTRPLSELQVKSSTPNLLRADKNQILDQNTLAKNKRKIQRSPSFDSKFSPVPSSRAKFDSKNGNADKKSLTNCNSRPIPQQNNNQKFILTKAKKKDKLMELTNKTFLEVLVKFSQQQSFTVDDLMNSMFPEILQNPAEKINTSSNTDDESKNKTNDLKNLKNDKKSSKTAEKISISNKSNSNSSNSNLLKIDKKTFDDTVEQKVAKKLKEQHDKKREKTTKVRNFYNIINVLEGLDLVKKDVEGQKNYIWKGKMGLQQFNLDFMEKMAVLRENALEKNNNKFGTFLKPEAVGTSRGGASDCVSGTESRNASATSIQEIQIIKDKTKADYSLEAITRNLLMILFETKNLRFEGFKNRLKFRLSL